jgi:hypothetical protein
LATVVKNTYSQAQKFETALVGTGKLFVVWGTKMDVTSLYILNILYGSIVYNIFKCMT